MPTTPYAQLQVSISGGAWTTGAVACAAGNTVQVRANPAGGAVARMLGADLTLFRQERL